MITLPQWQFVEDPQHRWRWRCATRHVRAVCVRTFATRADCLADALAVVGAAPDLRRRDSLRG
jgi:hypothetical protein